MTDTLDTKTTKEWEKNMKFFETHKNEIVWRYGRSRYIVIENEQIIDSGLDNFALAKRYNGKDVLITNIKSFEEGLQMPSPEIA